MPLRTRNCWISQGGYINGKYQGREDSNTIKYYTVTVYYTQAFKQHTADPRTFIDQVKGWFFFSE